MVIGDQNRYFWPIPKRQTWCKSNSANASGNTIPIVILVATSCSGHISCLQELGNLRLQQMGSLPRINISGLNTYASRIFNFK